jgi:hypothetical protein
MRYPFAYRYHIHRETIESITKTLHTRCILGIHTHLGKVKVHNHSIGNNRADALAN